MFAFVYEFALMALAIISLPKMLYQYWAHKKYATNFLRRLGRDFPAIEKKGRCLIWIHAVSLGETKVAASLVKKIKQETHNSLIVISSVTETGHEEAKKAIPQADYKFYLPFDFAWMIKPVLNKVKPDMVIVCESDFWYNFLNSAKQNYHAPVVVVNGKISERSQKRLTKFSWFAHHLLSPIDFFCLQNRHYQDRFQQVGIPASKMTITGNMKFDGATTALSAEDLSKLKLQFGIQQDDLVLVAGSTHDPEEKIILTVFEKLLPKFPNLKVIIVPRHPERFNEVANLIEQLRLPYQRFTKLDSGKAAKVILIDAMGVLRQCYQMATAAFVGGSLTSKIGGHNILEPSSYGVPVLFGPHMHQQPELVELVSEYQCGAQVDEHTLEGELQSLLSNPAKRKVQGEAGMKMMTELQGSVSKTWESIKNYVPAKAFSNPILK